MAQHVYARVSGFGWTLLPLAPYRFEQPAGDPPAVRATHHHPDGDRTVVVRIDGADLRWSPVTPGVRLADVLDVSHAPDSGDRWAIESTVFVCDWPAGFALQSTGTPFDLVGPAGELVWVQGPLPADRVPPPDRMAEPGQTVLAANGSRAEVGYRHEGREWRKVYRVLAIAEHGVKLVVTSQAPLDAAGSAALAGDEVFRSLRPYRGEPPA